MQTTEHVPENQYRCDACGRWFDTRDELSLHEPECTAAEQTGRQNKPRADGEKDLGHDRTWRPVP